MPVCEAELRWAAAHELALTPEDLADRRTRAGLVPEWREVVLAAARATIPGWSSASSPPPTSTTSRELIADPDDAALHARPRAAARGLRAGAGTSATSRARETGTKEAFAIVGDDGAFLGLALAPSIDEEAAEAELGYIVAAHARGRGVASEALRSSPRWAFEERGIQRAYLLIDVDNPASSTVAERAGYRLEGVMRSTYLKQGRRGDTELWSRLPGDPPVTTAR